MHGQTTYRIVSYRIQDALRECALYNTLCNFSYVYIAPALQMAQYTQEEANNKNKKKRGGRKYTLMMHSTSPH